MEFQEFEFTHEDIINTMPDDVVTNILDQLPIQDAVRTSILSRNWRFKWTIVTQLVFDDNFFQYLLKTRGENNYGEIVSRLLRLKGAITKFVLSIDEHAHSILQYEDIKRWIMLLSTNGIKDLTFRKSKDKRTLVLPTNLFDCLELKHLKLYNCIVLPPHWFHGFPNLLSFEFDLVLYDTVELGKCITQCPLLEILNMHCRGSSEMLECDRFSVGKVKLVEIATLANLKTLYLSSCHLENMKITNSSCIFELVGRLPKLQELDLDFGKCKFTEGGAERRSPTAFSCLNVLKLTRTDLGKGSMLSCAFKLIKCFPNLQTLEITTVECDADPPHASCSPEVQYNMTGLLQLRRVVFKDLKGSENDLCLIKYLLECSPFLRNIVIHPHLSLASGEKLFTRKLLQLRRASPAAVINLY